MNSNSISATNFKGTLPKLEEGYTWAKDNGCPECGLYPRMQLERTPKEDTFEISFKIPKGVVQDVCPEGYHPEYTYDNRKIFVPNYKG